MKGPAKTSLLFASALFVVAATSALAANPPNALDAAPSSVTPPPVDMLQTTPTQQSAPEKPREPGGNPLWAIPLSTLPATRERPLFSPSRRPPAPAVVGPPPAQPATAAAPPPPSGPERPQLLLVGAIVGDSGGIAIFIDQTTNDAVRLKIGESHSGWILRAVKGREATLQNERMTTTLALPAPNSVVPSPPVPGGVPPQVPAATRPSQQPPPGYSRTPTGEIVNTE